MIPASSGVSSDNQRREGVAQAVKDLDSALGRPPFANPCDPSALAAAEHLRSCIEELQQAGKLGVLEKEATVATTLPILCASLPEGSESKRPCLQLYRMLLWCLAPVCLFSTYPIPSILATAEALLPHDDEILFQMTASAHALTPERLRRFLSLPDSSAPVPAQARSKKGKKGTKASDDGPQQPMEVTVRPISRALVYTILATPLEPPLVAIFLTLLNTAEGFAAHVGSDAALAASVLQVYGGLLLPSVTAASLVPCLDVDTLPYMVDVVARDALSSPATGSHTLDSHVALESALGTWAPERVERLTAHIATSPPVANSSEAVGALPVYAFVARVARRLDVGGDKLRDLCTVLLDTATSALTSHVPPRPPQVFINTTGDLLVAHENLFFVLEPLQTVADIVEEVYVVDACCQHRAPPGDTAARWGASPTTAVSVTQLRRKAQALSATLCSRLEELSRKKPSPAPTATAPSVSPPLTGKAASSKNTKRENSKNSKAKNGQQMGKSSSSDASNMAIHSQEATAAPSCLLSDLVAQWTRVQFALGTMAGGPCTTASLNTLVNVLEYVQKHQRRSLPTSTYAAFLNFCALFGWQQAPPEAHSEAWTATSAQLPELMTKAVRLTSRCTWASCLFRSFSASESLTQSDTFVSLASALLAAATVHRETDRIAAKSPSDAPRPDKDTVLAPLSASAVTGLLGFQLSDAQLAQVADAVARTGVPLAAYVQGQLDRFVAETSGNTGASDARSFLFATATTAENCVDWFPDELGTHVVHGLQRLREALMNAAQSLQSSAQETSQARAEAHQQIVLRKVAEAERLASISAAFEAAKAQRLRAKVEQQTRLREEIEARQQRRAQQQSEEKAARARKRAQAIATMQEMARCSAEAREKQRKARLSTYQRRQVQAFRVGTFLEQLGLPTSRIIDVQRVVQPLLDTITPDDLLEYLVTGKPQVPRDMLDIEGDSTGRDHAAARAEAPGSTHATVQGFWDSVMQSAKLDAHAADVAPTAVAQDRSFHLRVSPFLDLFCYDGGDEFGTVPDPLPQLRVSVARRVVPLSDIKEMGFDSLDAVFSRLGDRGLLTVQSGMAQLTLIGFRYHFPFHNEERMLEIQVQQNRERVRAVLLAQRGDPFAGVLEDDNLFADEEDEGDDESEDDDNRVLPDDEFGI